METKTCSKCKTVKEEDQFVKGRNTCRDCSNKARREKLALQRQNLDETKTKTCTKCKENKSEISFKVGSAYCKICEASVKKKRLEKAKQELSDTKKCLQCEKTKSSDNFRLAENVCKECQKEKLYKWRKDNPEKFAKICKTYRNRPDYREIQNNSKRERYQKNPQENLRLNTRKHMRDFLFRGVISKKIDEIIGLDRDRFRSWIEFNFKPNMTWDNYNTKWNIDHIKPCSSFDLENKEELKKCFSWRNTVPVYCKENLEKFNKQDEDLEKYYEMRARIFEDEKTQYNIKKKLNN